MRYVVSHALVFDAGKLQPVVGTFTPRHFSNRNPLIGAPDGYSLQYPLGVEVTGEAGWFDYRAAMVSLPPTHASYVPSRRRACAPRSAPASRRWSGCGSAGRSRLGRISTRATTP